MQLHLCLMVFCDMIRRRRFVVFFGDRAAVSLVSEVL